MRWTKIKNIIILLLVVVNLFLLGLVGLRNWRTQQNARLARERMVTILENNGVAFLPGEVPDLLELTGRRLTVAPPSGDEAQVLVGQIVGQTAQGLRTVYDGEWGTATLSSSGEIEVSYTEPVYTETQALELLASLGVEVKEAGRESEGAQTTVTLTQLWEGTPLPGQTASMVCRGDRVESLSFRRLVGTAESVSPGGETITAATALIRFLAAMNQEGYVCSQVTNMYAGYSLSGSSTVTLTPVWYVETDASPWRFAVDGTTGTVTAAG